MKVITVEKIETIGKMGENRDKVESQMVPLQTVARRRSFSDRMEMEIDSLRRERDLERSEKEHYKRKYELAEKEKEDYKRKYELSEKEKEDYKSCLEVLREEHELLKKEVFRNQQPDCPGIIVQHSHVQREPPVETEVFQSTSPPTGGEDHQQNPDEEDLPIDGFQCQLCQRQFCDQLPGKVPHCSDCDRFYEKEGCDSQDYQRCKRKT